MTLMEIYTKVKAKVALPKTAKQRYYEELESFRRTRNFHKKKFPNAEQRATNALSAILGSGMTLSTNKASTMRVTTHAENICQLSGWLNTLTVCINGGDEEIETKGGFDVMRSQSKELTIAQLFTVSDSFGVERVLGSDNIKSWVSSANAFRNAISLKQLRDPDYLKRHTLLTGIVTSVITPVSEAIWNSRSPV